MTPGTKVGLTPGMSAPGDFAFAHIVGQSRALRGAVHYARRVGEPGTGKGVFARAIHYARPGGHGPFLNVSCKTAAPQLLETELFGHEPGIYDGADDREAGILELAGTGTVLLEHVDRLPARLQPKLLKALEERLARRRGGLDEFQVRCTVVASASQPLEELVADGTFREDLFLMLNDVRIALPALRERPEDVVLLAQHFLRETMREQGLRPLQLADDALQALQAYDWPGNVRELRTVMRQAAETATAGSIQALDLNISTRKSYPLVDAMPPAAEIPIPAEGRSLKDIEAEVIRATPLRRARSATRAGMLPARLTRGGWRKSAAPLPWWLPATIVLNVTPRTAAPRDGSNPSEGGRDAASSGSPLCQPTGCGWLRATSPSRLVQSASGATKPTPGTSRSTPACRTATAVGAPHRTWNEAFQYGGVGL
jgi:transcriptional regulator with GAF, ATPase, and Fis domain